MHSMEVHGIQAPGASAPAAGGGHGGGDAAGVGADVLAEVSFDGGFRVPGSIYNRLFDYQKTGKPPQWDALHANVLRNESRLPGRMRHVLAGTLRP